MYSLLVKLNGRRSYFAYRILWLSQLANLYSQPDLPTGIWLPNKSNFVFFKGVWQWNLSFGTK